MKNEASKTNEHWRQILTVDLRIPTVHPADRDTAAPPLPPRPTPPHAAGAKWLEKKLQGFPAAMKKRLPSRNEKRLPSRNEKRLPSRYEKRLPSRYEKEASQPL